MIRIPHVLVWCLLPCAFSCVRGHDRFNVEMQAAEDLNCPKHELVVDSPGGDIFMAQGCGREATYVCYRSQSKRFECDLKEKSEAQ